MGFSGMPVHIPEIRRYEAMHSLCKGVRSGVYFALDKNTGLSKIGMSKDVPQRLCGLQVHHKGSLYVWHALESRCPSLSELCLHSLFGQFQVEGEWFDLSPWLLRQVRLMTESPFEPYIPRLIPRSGRHAERLRIEAKDFGQQCWESLSCRFDARIEPVQFRII